MKKLESKKAFFLVLATLIFTISVTAQIKNVGELNTWTKSPFARQVSESGELVNVRSAKNKGYDRVVFEFKDKIPSYKIEFSKPPFYYGESENEAKISGKTFIRVTFNSTSAHNIETGKSILSYKKGRLGLPSVQETAFVYDFEGTVEFIIGLKQSRNFRITELKNPDRLVVDIKH